MEIELNFGKQIENLSNNEKLINIENENNVELLVEQEASIENQNNFLQSTLGKTINAAIDIGLRAILPDMIEEQVINIKDILFNNGLKEGIDFAIKSGIEFGKGAIGIVTGKFENLSQAHNAVKNGGIIDNISETLDNVLEVATKNELISKTTSSLIKKGKNAILDTISNNIEEKFMEDVHSLELVSKYISNWKNYYNLKDFDGMEKEYKKIKNKMNTIMALDNTIKEAKQIENVHNLIKNKGIDYELSEEEKELIKILN